MSQYDASSRAGHAISVTARLADWRSTRVLAALRACLLIASGIALLTISAKIKVPFYPVPMTLQTMTVGLMAATLGPRTSVSAILGYIAIGLVGVPVFTNTPPSLAGLGYLAGPTGGYLIGFIVAATLIGTLCKRGWDRSFVKLWLAMLLGDAAIIGLGVTWLAFGGPSLGLEKALAVGLYPFILGALFKEMLGAALIRAMSGALRT